MEDRSFYGRKKGSRNFTRLVGAEYHLLQQAGGKVLMTFYFSASVILLIAILSFLSIRYAIELLFHNPIVEVSLSVFLSLLFVVMYIFLLNTFTESGKKHEKFSMSNVIRTGFVIFMAFMISKPVEVYLFDTSLTRKVGDYKSRLYAEHIKKIDVLYVADMGLLLKKRNYYDNLNASHVFDEQINLIDRKLNLLQEKKEKLVDASKARIERADYFVYRVRQVSENISAWLICLLVTVLFLLPGYLVYLIATQGEYFKIKKSYEERIVLKDYRKFLKDYKELFWNKHGCEIEIFSNYEDPPFNSRLKEAVRYESSTEFYKKYCQ